MNIENINKLIDFLKTLPPENFDHNTWAANYQNINEIPGRGLCGTIACIAGWTTILSNPDDWIVTSGSNILYYAGHEGSIRSDATEWLDFDYTEDDIVFTPFLMISERIIETIYNEGFTNVDFPEIVSVIKGWNGATREQAIKFLERIVEEKTVKLFWWVEMIASDLL